MKKIAIVQSNYIPWKGYFDIINKVDLLIFHDDLQYTKNDWRNRNKIKTPDGLKWLTIPCGTNEKRLICEVELKDFSWQRKHWSVIENNYRHAPYFKVYEKKIKSFYLDKKWCNLSELNQYLIKMIAREFLGIKHTAFGDSRNYNLKYSKGERVIELLKKADAGEYLSGPAAKNYLEEKVFKSNNISLKWIDYSGYPEYKQLYPPFEHNVSIIDLLFNIGSNANKYFKSFYEKK